MTEETNAAHSGGAQPSSLDLVFTLTISLTELILHLVMDDLFDSQVEDQSFKAILGIHKFLPPLP